MPLVDRNIAVDRAEALIKSMLNLLRHDAVAAGSKRARENEDTDDEMEEMELEGDDIDADMLALEEIANEIVHEVVKTFPVNLTEPERVWTLEMGFYEKLRKLYQPEYQTLGDRYSPHLNVARGWARTLPLHVLIEDKYLIQILQLDPLSFFLFVEKDSVEADFAIRAIKFTFCSDGQCKSSRRITQP